MTDKKCPISRAEAAQSTWKKHLAGYLNGIPIEKAFPWNNLLNGDVLTVQAALKPITAAGLTGDFFTNFFKKLASVIPNSHCRNILLKYYLESIISDLQGQGGSDLLVTLVEFYPLAVHMIHIMFKPHFQAHLKVGQSLEESEVIKWCEPYLNHVFSARDFSLASATVDFLAQFRFRSVHEFLLDTASRPPQPARSEYWLLLHKILTVVVPPATPPALVSYNKYSSVLFSVIASLQTGSPLDPDSFLQICPPTSEDSFYKNVCLTPGLAGLAAYTILKYPIPSILPHISALISISHNSSLALCGTLLYPLTIIGRNNPHLAETVQDYVGKILSMPHGADRDDSSDSYAECCITTESTFYGLKLGQVLTDITFAKGTSDIEEQLGYLKTLTPVTASLMIHCLVLNKDRPSRKLISYLGLADDSTNVAILTFMLMHTRLIIEGKCPQTKKFIYVYILSLPDLFRRASISNLRRALKLISRSEDVFLNNVFYEVYFNSLLQLWMDHGGEVGEKLLHLLHNHTPRQVQVVSVIVRRMCASDREVEEYVIANIVTKSLLHHGNNDVVIGNGIDALTFLCKASGNYRSYERVVEVYMDKSDSASIALPLCFWYSEYIEYLASLMEGTSLGDIRQFGQTSEAAHKAFFSKTSECVEKLWQFTRHIDSETAGMAYKGLLNSGLFFLSDTAEVMDGVLHLFSCYDYPKYSEQFVAELITMELNKNPPTLEPGSGPNWAKKLLESVKGQENNPAQPVVNSLFSFQKVVFNASRDQHKKQLNKSSALLFKLLERSAAKTSLFDSVFDGIQLVEGWCHFMTQYLDAIISTPTYQNAPSNRNTQTMEQKLTDAKRKVKDEVQQHLAKLSDQADDTRRMTLNVLTITGLDYAYFKLGQEHKLDLNFRENLGGGIMRNMLRVQSSTSNTETYCVILLCMSRLAQVLQQIDTIGLRLNLEMCTKKLQEKPNNGLLTNCAAVAIGVSVHSFYKVNPKHNLNKDALQILLNGPYYLGLSFCVDSFFNSNQIGKVDRFIAEFQQDIVTDITGDMTADHILFIGLLLVFSVYVNMDHIQEVDDFLGYLNNEIVNSTRSEDLEILLITQGFILHFLSSWQESQQVWRELYSDCVSQLAGKYNEGSCAKPVLSALTGFPFTPLVNWFDWGPNLEFSSVMERYLVVSSSASSNYPAGALTTLMTARYLQNHAPCMRLRFNPIANPLWSRVFDMLVVDNSEKRKTRFILDVLSHVKRRLPINNPVQLLVSLYTRTTLKVDVLKFAATHITYTHPVYMEFISRFLTLSIFPLLPAEGQNELMKLLPTYIYQIKEGTGWTYKSFFSTFLSEVFWQGGKELRLTVLDVMESFIDPKQHPTFCEDALAGLSSKFFVTSKFSAVLAKQTIQKMGHLMRAAGFMDFTQLHDQSLIVEECVTAGYHVPKLTQTFFNSYLDQENVASLQRTMVRILLTLSKDDAYGLLVGLIERAKAEFTKNPKDFMKPGVACMNSVMFAFLVESNTTKPLGHGLEHFAYLGYFLEPEINSKCVLEVLQNQEPWNRLIRLYNDFFEA
eukprot:sb/3460825/